MKVGITGHTRGIGSWIKEYFESEGHEVLGISTKDGINLSDAHIVFDRFKDCDVFINNAYQSFAQTRLLYHFYDQWKDTNKLIISIGSSVIYRDVPFHLSVNNLKKFWIYKNHKLALSEASRQCYNDAGSCRALMFNPGITDTDMVSYIPSDIKRMNKEQVIDCFKFVVNSKVNIQNITFSVIP